MLDLYNPPQPFTIIFPFLKTNEVTKGSNFEESCKEIKTALLMPYSLSESITSIDSFLISFLYFIP